MLVCVCRVDASFIFRLFFNFTAESFVSTVVFYACMFCLFVSSYWLGFMMPFGALDW